MSRRSKIIFSLLAAAAILIIAGARFFTVIQAEELSQEEQAILAAKQQTDLTEAAGAEPYVGDTSDMIVYGQDKDGRAMIVWVSEQGVHAEYASQGITREALKQTMLAKNPDIRFKRLRPGKLHDMYVWEVYYQKKEGGQLRDFYDYYRFSDGMYIDTYSLSLR